MYLKLKTFFRTFVICILCLFSFSCNFVNENNGTIQFFLPDEINNEENRSFLRSGSYAVPDEYNILVKYEDNSVVLNKTYPKGDSVFIEGLQCGNYEISVYAETETALFKGREKVEVLSGSENHVKICLTKTDKPVINPEPEKPGPENPEPEKPGPENPEPEKPEPEKPDLEKTVTIKGNITGDSVPDDVSLTVQAEDTSNTAKKYQGVVTGNKTYVIDKLPAGNTYKVTIAGSNSDYKYSGSATVSVSAGDKEKSCEINVKAESIILTKDLTVNLTGYDTGVSLNYTITPDNKSGTVTSSSFVIKDLTVGKTYTVSISGESDSNTYNGNSGDVKIESGKNNEVSISLEKVPIEKPVEGTPAENIDQLRSALANGGNIKLSKGFEISGAKLTVTKDTNIVADSSVTLTRGASYKDALFTVNDGVSLTITGPSAADRIILDGNNVAASSPLIISYGNLTIENCILQNNKTTEASEVMGLDPHSGALYFGKNEQTIQNLVIRNTDIINNEGFSKEAGIITIEQKNTYYGSRTIISDCNIKNNKACDGALNIIGDGSKKPDVEITNTTITGNTSTKNGGGINTKNSNIILDSVNINGNTANTNGGGIYMNTGAGLTIKNSTVLETNHLSNGKEQNLLIQNQNGASLIIEKDGTQNKVSIKNNFSINSKFDINWTPAQP